MKKHITLALGLLVLSGSAFASKARLEALGEDANGSQFLSDSRNVFLNAAHVNYHKDFATYEWGSTTQTTDGTATPKAEGGAFMSSGNMVYGLYFGSENNLSNSWRNTVSTPLEQSVVDFFVGGDAGVQWGASLTYAATKDEQAATEPEQSAMRARIGVISGDLEGFANIGISNKAETTAAEFNGKGSFDVGVTYNMNDLAYMARVTSAEAEEKNSSTDFKYQRTNIGVAKTYKLNDKASLWASAWYKTVTSEVGTAETKSTSLPVGIALEVSAREWLVLRGSVAQSVLIGEEENSDGDKKSLDDTAVAAGASLVFGDLSIDGMIGNDAGDDGATVGADTSTGNGTLRTDALMSRVSMTYRF